MSEAAGWYPDPFFGGRERYWDGDEWTEKCRTSDTKEHQASAKPRAPLNPERATPSAVAAKFERRAGGGGLATMARPAARETASASPTMTPPTTSPPTSSPPSPPPTAIADDSKPVTPAWPTDTGWTIGAVAATAAAGATDTPTAVPPTFEPPGPTTDAVPAFDEPTDHTEEILSRTVEVPATVHDWSRVMPPEEPTLSEEVLDETYLAPATAEASEEPAVAEEVLAETPPEVLPEEALVATAAVASLTPQILDEPDVAPETAEAPEEAQEPTVTEEVLAEAAPRVEADEAPVTTAEAPSLTEEALEETEPERAAGVVARGAEADEPKPEPEPERRPTRTRPPKPSDPAGGGGSWWASAPSSSS